MAPTPPSAQEVLDGIACYDEALARVIAAGRGNGRPDRPAMAACKGDARSMGHARRTFPPGPLPEGIPVGFCLKSRAAGFVGGLFATTMHGIEMEERRSGVAVTLVAGGNYNNRMVECGGLMEDQLGSATCVIEGQGGQQHNNGVQIAHQTFDSSGNAGMRRAQEAGSPLRLWLKVAMRNPQLKEQYGLCYTGQWKVTDSWLWTNPRDGFRRCRFLLQRLPGQAPMPRLPLYIRGESGAKRANQLQQLCTEALWDGSLGGSVLADVCSKCWCVSNFHEFAGSFGIDLACGGKGWRRRRQGGGSSSSSRGGTAEEGGNAEEGSEEEEEGEQADGHHQLGSGTSGDGDGRQQGGNLLGAQGTQQAGEQRQRGRHTRPPPAPRPNVVCSSCHVAEVCHSCLSDAAFKRYAGTDEPWLCAYCEAVGKRQPTAGIPSVTATPSIVTALAKQAAAALAGSQQLVAEGRLQADTAREQELRAAAEQWRQRAQRLGIELKSLAGSAAAAAAAGHGKVERQGEQQGRRQQQQELPAGQTEQQQQGRGRRQQELPADQTQQQQQRRRQQQQQQLQGAEEQVSAGPLSAGGQKRPHSEQAMGVPDDSLATPATKRPAPSSQHDACNPAASPAPAAALAAAAGRATPVTPAQAAALPPVTPGSAQGVASSEPAQQVQQHRGQHPVQPLTEEWHQQQQQQQQQQQVPIQPWSAAGVCCLEATAFGAADPADSRARADAAATLAAATTAVAGAAVSAACTAGAEEREVEMLELLSGLLDLLEGRVRPAELLAFSERFKGGSSSTKLGLARRKVLARQLGIAAGQGGTALLNLLAQPIDPVAAGTK